MVTYLTHIKDILGQNYIGIKFSKPQIQPFLDELKEHLGDDFDEYVGNQQKRDRDSNHMTVINVGDYNRLTKEIGMAKFVKQVGKLFTYELDDVKLMGVGTATNETNTTYFIVCKSDKLNAIRKRYDLKEHDLHITLGFKHKDVFGQRKNKVMKKRSKFIHLFKQKFMEKENFHFLKEIDNWDENPDKDILPIELTANHILVKVDDNLIRVGLVDGQTGEKMTVTNRYTDEDNRKRLPLTDIIQFLREKN